MSKNHYSTFFDFSVMAKSNLKPSHKIGFDENTRSAEIDKILLEDMFQKVNYLLESNLNNSNILDIGCGCSYFTNYLIEHSISNNNNLYLIDSEEMLSNINDHYDNVTKIAGKFPVKSLILEKLESKINLIIINSVIQHIMLEDDIFKFLDSTIKYLEHFGVIYIGDLPNASKQNRQIDNYKLDNFKRHKILGENRINDSIIFSLISYFRGLGFNAYILPKPFTYKFSNSREDIIITKI